MGMIWYSRLQLLSNQMLVWNCPQPQTMCQYDSLVKSQCAECLLRICKAAQEVDSVLNIDRQDVHIVVQTMVLTDL